MATKKDRDLKEHLTVAAQVLQAVAKPILEGLTVVLPIVITYTQIAYREFSKLPQNAIHFVNGTVFCFFGGSFPTLFAAIQAAEYGGRAKLLGAFSALTEEATIIIEESKKDDDAQDKNKKEPSSEYVARKTKLVLRKMNPEKFDNAMGSIYSVWLSVAAVLSVEFARTISMALAIADFLKKPLDRFVTPTINMVVPDEYEKWVPIVMSWIAKSIAMSIAWYIQVCILTLIQIVSYPLMIARYSPSFVVEDCCFSLFVFLERWTNDGSSCLPILCSS